MAHVVFELSGEVAKGDQPGRELLLPSEVEVLAECTEQVLVVFDLVELDLPNLRWDVFVGAELHLGTFTLEDTNPVLRGETPNSKCLRYGLNDDGEGLRLIGVSLKSADGVLERAVFVPDLFWRKDDVSLRLYHLYI